MLNSCSNTVQIYCCSTLLWLNLQIIQFVELILCIFHLPVVLVPLITFISCHCNVPPVSKV